MGEDKNRAEAEEKKVLAVKWQNGAAKYLLLPTFFTYTAHKVQTDGDGKTKPNWENSSRFNITEDEASDFAKQHKIIDKNAEFDFEKAKLIYNEFLISFNHNNHYLTSAVGGGSLAHLAMRGRRSVSNRREFMVDAVKGGVSLLGIFAATKLASPAIVKSITKVDQRPMASADYLREKYDLTQESANSIASSLKDAYINITLEAIARSAVVAPIFQEFILQGYSAVSAWEINRQKKEAEQEAETELTPDL